MVANLEVAHIGAKLAHDASAFMPQDRREHPLRIGPR